jgi:hypothetical protein
MGKFQVEKLVNVWKPHLKSLPLNCYMSQNKTFTINLQTFENLSCTNLKFDLKLLTLANNSLWHTWNLKLSTTWKTSLTHTSNFNIESFNNLKNSSTHFHKLQRWIPQQLEELSFTHFELKTWNLNTWRTLFHTWELTTLWRSLFHTSHSLGKIASSLYATTWKWAPTHFAN